MGRPPLTGRDDELARLADALTRCRSGRGGLVPVSGEAGVGQRRVENLTPDEVAREVAEGAVLVALREPAELQRDGTIEGTAHAPRGMLEFYADPSSPYHRPEFDPARRTVLFCASGGRSALGAVTLAALGYGDVAHLDGGLEAWRAEGRPTVPPPA